MADTRRRSNHSNEVQANIEAAYKLFQEKKIAAALFSFIGLNLPADYKVQLGIAKCYLADKNATLAIKTLTDLSKRIKLNNFQRMKVYTYLSNAHEMQKDYKRAKAALSAIDSEFHHRSEVIFGWISFYCKQKEYHAAHEVLMRLKGQKLTQVEQDSYDRFFHSINTNIGKKLESAQTILQKLEEQTKQYQQKRINGTVYAVYVDQVVKRLNAYQHNTQLINYIEKTLTAMLSNDDLEHEAIYITLARLYGDTNRVDAAIELMEKLQNRYPYSWDAINTCGWHYSKQAYDLEAAINTYKKVYEYKANDSRAPTKLQKAKAYFGTAMCFYDQNIHEENTIKYARLAINEDAAYAPAWSLLGKAYGDLAENLPTKSAHYKELSRAAFEEAKKLDPARFERLHGKGNEINHRNVDVVSVEKKKSFDYQSTNQQHWPTLTQSAAMLESNKADKPAKPIAQPASISSIPSTSKPDADLPKSPDVNANKASEVAAPLDQSEPDSQQPKLKKRKKKKKKTTPIASQKIHSAQQKSSIYSSIFGFFSSAAVVVAKTVDYFCDKENGSLFDVQIRK